MLVLCTTSGVYLCQYELYASFTACKSGICSYQAAIICSSLNLISSILSLTIDIMPLFQGSHLRGVPLYSKVMQIG